MGVGGVYGEIREGYLTWVGEEWVVSGGVRKGG